MKLSSERNPSWAATGSEIKEQFYDLINKIEKEISVNIETKASAATILARRTYIWACNVFPFGYSPGNNSNVHYYNGI